MKRIFRLNIDLPMYPKGTIIYNTWDMLPSKFNSDKYAGNELWYQEIKNEYDGTIIQAEVLRWLGELISICSMRMDSDPISRKIVTEITNK